MVDGRLGAEARRKAADDFAVGLAPMMTELRGKGMSLHQMAAGMMSKGIRTPRGGQWTATAVANVLARLS